MTPRYGLTLFWKGRQTHRVLLCGHHCCLALLARATAAVDRSSAAELTRHSLHALLQEAHRRHRHWRHAHWRQSAIRHLQHVRVDRWGSVGHRGVDGERWQSNGAVGSGRQGITARVYIQEHEWAECCCRSEACSCGHSSETKGCHGRRSRCRPISTKGLHSKPEWARCRWRERWRERPNRLVRRLRLEALREGRWKHDGRRCSLDGIVVRVQCRHIECGGRRWWRRGLQCGRWRRGRWNTTWSWKDQWQWRQWRGARERWWWR